MDGNARWARARGLPLTAGHAAGAAALRTAVSVCAAAGVRQLDAFALSGANVQGRPPAELASIFATVERSLAAELPKLHERRVRLSFACTSAGAVPSALAASLRAAAALTRGNDGMRLAVYIAYSGREHLLACARWLMRSGAAPETLDDALFSRAMRETAAPPGWLAPSSDDDEAPPDLLLRSGGCRRMSDFLSSWDTAFTELRFIDELWPDVGESQLVSAFSQYAAVERRWGGRRIIPSEAAHE
jgi:undecaprenyl diphosphate synthase